MQSAKYLRDESILPVPGDEKMLAVWSRPKVNGTGKPLQAKLGGTGLGLVALVSVEDIAPGFVPIGDLRALGRFIIYMQKIAKKPEGRSGANKFNRRVTEVRIDYVQHALCAMLQYLPLTQ